MGQSLGQECPDLGHEPMPRQLPCCRGSKAPAGQCKPTQPSARPSAGVAPERVPGQPGVPGTTQPHRGWLRAVPAVTV